MIDRVKKLLAAREGAMLERTRRLVEENSFTENVEGGNRVGAILAGELSAIAGLDVRSVPSPSGRFAAHWVASSKLARDSAAGSTALVGHLDTVFPPGVFEGFRVEAGIARGPGALDMKGGLALVTEVLAVLAEVGMLDSLPIRFVIVSDEEVGSPEGSTIIGREVSGAGAALVFEAGRKADAIITARKGTGSLRAVAEGRAAHAGAAHADGANAIWALSRFVDRAQSLTDYAKGITVNVGKVLGGQSKNTVPDHAEAFLDFRFVTTADGNAVVASLKEAARSAAESIPGTKILLEGGLARPGLERTDGNLALYREYAAYARASGLGDAEAPLIGGGSDAATTAALGIPSIDGLGPRGSGFHTKEELFEVASLVPKAQALAGFLLGRLPRSP